MSLKMALVMKVILLQMTPLLKICRRCWKQNDAFGNGINQYEDEEQQSITEELFDNDGTKQTVCSRGTNESR